jgi:myo-inositol-1(or 4)-monophosphatase
VTDTLVTEALDLSAELSLIRAAAMHAGGIAMSYFGQSPKITWKGGNSPVTEADHAADDYLRRTLIGARPDYGWLSEESGQHDGEKTARRIFVVDPIDGTRAFIDGKDVWCVSVAIVENNRPIAGVLACPARGETYTAIKGQGAFLNQARLPALRPGVALRFAGAKSWLGPDMSSFGRAVTFVPHVPSLAYRIAMIANGALDGTFVKPDSHDWDLAAADLILGECGGAVLTEHGDRPLYAKANPSHGVLVAGAAHVTAEMLQVVRRASLG